MTRQPPSVRTAAAGVERGGDRRNAVPVQFVDSGGRQPRRQTTEALVHMQVPRSGRVDLRDSLDNLRIGNRVDFVATPCLGREHAEQPGAVHGIVDDSGQPSVSLGVRCVFHDQRAKPFDLGK